MNGEHTALVHTTSGEPSRTDRTVSWLGWHLGELGGIGAPLVLAVTVSPWWAAVSGVVTAGWVAHELHTRQAATTTPVTAGAAVEQQEQGVNTVGEGVRRGELA